MAVDRRCLDGRVAHELLDSGHTNTQLVLPGCKCPPSCVAARINACCAVNGLDPRRQGDGAHVPTRARAGDQWCCVGHFS